jgi:hypothetical protein
MAKFTATPAYCSLHMELQELSINSNVFSWSLSTGREGWYTLALLSDGCIPMNLAVYTDKKEIKIFLIFKEIQSGAVAKSYMRKGILMFEEMRKYFPRYEEAVSHDIATAPF